MHTVKDARVFVESLNLEQRRALSGALLMPGDAREQDELNLLAGRLWNAILLVRVVAHVARWKQP